MSNMALSLHNKSWMELQKNYEQEDKSKPPRDQVCDFYDKWADMHDEIVDALSYHGPKLATQYFMEQVSKEGISPLSARLLDVGAGTGHLAQCLHDLGFYNIDAVDACNAMLDKAKDKHLYKNYFCAWVEQPHSIPVDDNYYDAVLTVGTMAWGHIEISTFKEFMRVTKPGGLVLNCTREEITQRPNYSNLEEQFAAWESEGLWTCVQRVLPQETYIMDKRGIIHIYKVLK